LAKTRVAVAMSGGVDSSVAALVLVRKGFDVVGLTMKLLADPPSDDGLVARPCCTLDMARDAQKVCHSLGIPHYTINLVEEFETEVILPFILDYGSGRTPNPCLLCNTRLKLGHLLKRAREIGADYLATGHYARAGRFLADGTFVDNHNLVGESHSLEGSERSEGLRDCKSIDGPDPSGKAESGYKPAPAKVRGGATDGRIFLLRGKDKTKDQSYALYGLTQGLLSSAMFPLGSLAKKEVREIAAKEGLPTATRPESQELCFITQGTYRTFLAERGVPVEPGPILDTSGRVRGRHRGIPFYTIGQRKGLGVASTRPLYVVDIDAGRNAVIVGEREEAYSGGAYIEAVNLIACDTLESPVQGTCMVRYRGKEVLATMMPVPPEKGAAGGTGLEEAHLKDVSSIHDWAKGKTALVRFEEPQFAVTPGQALVFYQGDVVFGGGIISRRAET